MYLRLVHVHVTLFFQSCAFTRQYVVFCAPAAAICSGIIFVEQRINCVKLNLSTFSSTCTKSNSFLFNLNSEGYFLGHDFFCRRSFLAVNQRSCRFIQAFIRNSCRFSRSPQDSFSKRL